jgi:rubrerythrin
MGVQLDSVEKILDFAIGQEEEAAKFYSDLAGRMEHEHMRRVFLDFAQEEKGHKAKLVNIKHGGQMLPAEQRVLDMKLGDHMRDIQLSAEMDYKEALIVAMKAEKAAFKLYHHLASATDDPGLKATLLGLANEEAKHKLRFEIEYEDEFLQEN